MNQGRRITKLAATGALAGAAALAVAGAATSALAAHFTRRVVTLEKPHANNLRVISVGAGTVTITANDDTTAPGLAGIWLDDNKTHLRVGEVVSQDGKSVTRNLLDVDFGQVKPGPGRWNNHYLIGDPTNACDLDFSEIQLNTVNGPVPAWHIPAAQATTQWAVLIHGRGGYRTECLRAAPVLHQLGYNLLIPTYRNSHEGPRTKDGRCELGATEWQDLETALDYIQDQGGEEYAIVGWSMGGAIALQLAHHSAHRENINALVLDSPVVSWPEVLEHQAHSHNLPTAVDSLSRRLLDHPRGHRLVGTSQPIHLDDLDWVKRSEELHTPMLICHSMADTRVPPLPALQLKDLRPDLVTYVNFEGARHIRNWNVDPDLWETSVARFLLEHR